MHRGRALDRRGGPVARRLLRRRARRRAARRLRPGADRLPRQQQDPSPSCARAVEAGVGRIIVDSFDEIERLDDDRRASSGVAPGVLVRVTVGVEAHTHEYIATAHEDQKFGFSIASGDAFDGGTPGARAPPGLELLGLHSHIGIADLRHLRLRGRRPPGARAARAGRPRSSASTLPELDLGGGFGIAYTTQDDPADPAQLADRDDQDRRARVPRRSASPCRGCRSSPAARSSARRCARVYEVGTVKEVALDGGARRAPTSASTAG